MHRLNLSFFGIAFMLLIALLVISPGGVTNVEANGGLNHLLQSDYAVSSTQTCVLSGSGFVGENYQLPDPGTWSAIQTFTLQGITHFNGDGTASTEGISLAINPNNEVPGGYPVSEVEYACDFNYNVNPDRSFTQGPVSCTGTILSGSPAFVGKQFNNFVGQRGIGQIGIGNQTILLSSNNANVETVTVLDFWGPGLHLTWDRICNRTGTGVKLP